MTVQETLLRALLELIFTSRITIFLEACEWEHTVLIFLSHPKRKCLTLVPIVLDTVCFYLPLPSRPMNGVSAQAGPTDDSPSVGWWRDLYPFCRACGSKVLVYSSHLGQRALNRHFLLIWNAAPVHPTFLGSFRSISSSHPLGSELCLPSCSSPGGELHQQLRPA